MSPSLNLPKPLMVFVNAVNAGDANAACVCFSEDATLFEEGQSLTGRKPIRDWIRALRKKYKHVTKPLGFREDAGEAIMTVELACGGGGSPIRLEYRCRINKKDLIEGLRVCQLSQAA